MDEVVNLVESPNVLLCKFDKKFLSVPKEILTLTMESHQKYFPTFNQKDEVTNEFLIVTNKKDQKGFIKIGNERVVEARLSDAEFFWNKDKTQNLVKKVSELKSMSFFKGLVSFLIDSNIGGAGYSEGMNASSQLNVQIIKIGRASCRERV